MSTKAVKTYKGKRTAEVRTSSKMPGRYCVVVTPNPGERRKPAFKGAQTSTLMFGCFKDRGVALERAEELAGAASLPRGKKKR